MLRLKLESETFKGGDHAAVPCLLATVVRNPETGACSVFALNRSTDQDMTLEVELRGCNLSSVTMASQLHHADLKAINTKEREVVQPAANTTVTLDGDILTATLKPQSWNVFTLA